MAPELAIGAFSRITHLSVKTLRHYHDWGVLEPATVDPDSGYRYYSPAQVSTAQTIRRYRDLEMPVEHVKAVLAAPNAEARDALVADHLRRMEEQLARTQGAVAALRALLENNPVAPAIEHVTFGPLQTMAITETVDRVRLKDWWQDAFTELFELLHRAGQAAAGPPGGTYEHSLFENDLGQCTVYVPVDAPVAAAGRAAPRYVEPRPLAVAVHAGPHADADLVYGALGTHVTELGIDGGGPAFERYLVSEFSGEADPDRWRTEIGWPISPPTTS